MPKPCSVTGCERRTRAKGYCSLHYQRWKRHGDPNIALSVGRPRLNPEQERTCQFCGVVFLFTPGKSSNRGLYCSRAHANRAFKPKRHRKGEDHPNWRGGRHVRKRDGYAQIQIRAENGSRPWALEHRLIMEEHLGRPLAPEETVHHINGIKDDNRIENLELWTSRHPKGQRVADVVAHSREMLALYGDRF